MQSSELEGEISCQESGIYRIEVGRDEEDWSLIPPSSV